MARNLSSAFTNARLQSQDSVPISNIVKNAAKPQEQVQEQEQVHADEEKEGKLRLVYVLAQRDMTLDATIRMNVTDIINAGYNGKLKCCCDASVDVHYLFTYIAFSPVLVVKRCKRFNGSCPRSTS